MRLRATPLLALHQERKARMADFAGWNMPIRYGSIIEEHTAVREKAGIFDVSHMGEIEIKGAGALDFLSFLLPTDPGRLEEGDMCYSALLNEEGGIIDDLMVYCISPTRYLLCVNASNRITDFKWIKRHAMDYESVEIDDLTLDYGMIALQGPNAAAILRNLVGFPLQNLNYLNFIPTIIDERNILLSRTGYTGEDGFEILCHWRDTPEIWKLLMTKGKSYGIKPVGLGARDTLRLEMRYPLHGNDIDEQITPLQAGLGFIVNINDDRNFMGRQALMQQRTDGIKQKLVGIQMTERGIPRAGYEVISDGESVGIIRSGAISPTLGVGIGTVYLAPDLAKPGTEVAIRIRDNEIPAKVIKGSFVRSGVKRTPTPQPEEQPKEILAKESR